MPQGLVGQFWASLRRRRIGTVFDLHGLCPQLFEALARFDVVSGQHVAGFTSKAGVLDMARSSGEDGGNPFQCCGGLGLSGKRAAQSVGVARRAAVLNVVVLGEAADLGKGTHALSSVQRHSCIRPRQ